MPGRYYNVPDVFGVQEAGLDDVIVYSRKGGETFDAAFMIFDTNEACMQAHKRMSALGMVCLPPMCAHAFQCFPYHLTDSFSGQSLWPLKDGGRDQDSANSSETLSM